MTKPTEREGGNLKRFTRIALVLTVATLGMLVAASAALAYHARPKSASGLAFKLVPAFNSAVPCNGGAPNGTHGTPLALPSCNPPVQTSQMLTLNAPDRPSPYNTGGAAGLGQILLKVTCVSAISPGPGPTGGVPTENGDVPPCGATGGDQADIKITASSTAIRCQGYTGLPGPADDQALCAGGTGAAAAGSLYNGKIQGSSQIEITDHYSSGTPTSVPDGCESSTPPNCPATVVSLPFSVAAQCASGACNYTTSADAVVTDVTKELKRAVVELGQITIADAGPDGNLSAGIPPTSGVCPPACSQDDTPNGIAFVQGLFIP
jgi:hypothetical protein